MQHCQWCILVCPVAFASNAAMPGCVNAFENFLARHQIDNFASACNQQVISSTVLHCKHGVFQVLLTADTSLCSFGRSFGFVILRTIGTFSNNCSSIDVVNHISHCVHPCALRYVYIHSINTFYVNCNLTFFYKKFNKYR